MTSDWTDSLFRRAPRGILCAFMREGWEKPTICKYGDWAPETNLSGLYWKLTGIGREELDSMNPQQRAYIEHPGCVPGMTGSLTAQLGAIQNAGFANQLFGSMLQTAANQSGWR